MPDPASVAATDTVTDLVLVYADPPSTEMEPVGALVSGAAIAAIVIERVADVPMTSPKIWP